MVDALRSAWQVLRPRGVVVDLQPADRYRPRLSLVSPRGARLALGAIARETHPGIAAAHRARRRAVSDGTFTRVVSLHAVERHRYDGPRELRALLEANDNWHLQPALRRRLDDAWSKRAPKSFLEVRQSFSLAVLRKRS